MREESHLDDMRRAIRGDFERLQERRGEQELMRVSENGDAEEPVAEAPPPAPKPEPPATEPEPEPKPAPEPELELEPDDQPDVREEASPETAPAAEPEPPERTWLDRLLGR